MNLKILILSSFMAFSVAFGGSSCQDILRQNVVKDFLATTSDDNFSLKQTECDKNGLSLKYSINDIILSYNEEQQKNLAENARWNIFHAYCDKDGTLKDFRNSSFFVHYRYINSKGGGFSMKIDENLCQRVKHGSN